MSVVSSFLAAINLLLLTRASAFTQSKLPTNHRQTLLLANGESGNWWEPTWTDVGILSNEKACQSGRTRCIKVNAPEEQQKEYRAPGQYIQVRYQEDLLCFLPIASSPRKDHFEFLIKDDGNEEKAWLLDLPAGTKLQLSSVLGKGFQPRELPTMKPATSIMDCENVVMACNGLGLASLKAAIESGSLQGGRLYYGERTVDDLCFADRFDEWEKDFKFEVIPVLSQPDNNPGHREGYVQDALKKDGVKGDADQCYSLVCGVMAMMDDVTDYLKEEGVSPTRIMLNLEA